MRIFRPLLLVAALGAFAISACGAPPDRSGSEVESTDSALHDANGMWIGGPYHLTGTYSCGGQTWTMKGNFDQTTFTQSTGALLYLSCIQPWFSDLDPTRPELTVSSCISADEGNQFFMNRSGDAVLYNIQRKTCILYSHTVGQTSWTAVSADASIEAVNFQYVKPGGTRGIQDRFQVVVNAATGVGNPGVCSSMSTVFYFASP